MVLIEKLDRIFLDELFLLWKMKKLFLVIIKKGIILKTFVQKIRNNVIIIDFSNMTSFWILRLKVFKFIP